MARTPLFRALRRAAQAAVAANRLDLPARDLTRQQIAEAATANGPQMTRRRFLLRSAGVVGAAVIGAQLLPGCRSAAVVNGANGVHDGAAQRIAIVGGGMAGLLCAYRLRQHGIRAHVYEAGGRFGGRIWSNRETFAGAGLVCEMGGELVNTDHVTMRGLAAEFDIPLDDLHEANAGLQEVLFHIGGRVLTEAEVIAMYRPLAARLAAIHARIEVDDDAYAEFDNISLAEFLDSVDIDPALRTLLDVAYTSEMGLEADRQSALLLIELIDFESDGEFKLLGDSDERFHVRGGNDRLIQGLVERLDEAQLHADHALVELAQAPTGEYRLTFQGGNGDGQSREVVADFVVLALPFATLRRVDRSGIELPAVKERLIRELAYGTNAKLMLGTSARPWRTEFRASGAAVTDVGDRGLQVIWDTAAGQAPQSAPGVITNFVGGILGERTIGTGTPVSQAERVMPLIDQLFAGTAEAFNGAATRMHWPSAPFARGSYACFQPGFVRLYEEVGKSVGRLLFCGEHCSHDHQGYMEGAAETGQAAAAELLAAIGATAVAAPRAG